MKKISMDDKGKFFSLAVEVANEAIDSLNSKSGQENSNEIARAQVKATLALTLATLDISMEIGIRV